MTRREFDALTKVNHSAPMGRRWAYRAERGHVFARDYIAERAAYMAHRNDRTGVLLDGYLPTLGVGSPFRAPQMLRLAMGVPLLTRTR
jgi:hypothetical protein